jgi:hypothetical protein
LTVTVRVFCARCTAAIDVSARALAGPVRAVCPSCGHDQELRPDEDLRAGRPPRACASCGEDRFYRRKRFPRRLGLFIVLAAAVLTFTSLVPPSLSFLPLIAASLVDLLLYLVLPWKAVCYVCEAEYTGPVGEDVAPFDLHVATEARKRARR